MLNATGEGDKDHDFASLDFAINGERGSTFRLLLALLQTCYMVNDANTVRLFSVSSQITLRPYSALITQLIFPRWNSRVP